MPLYTLSTYTSDKFGSGGAGRIFAKLIGDEAESRDFELGVGEKLFGRGIKSSFELDTRQIGNLKAVELWLDNKGVWLNTDWHLAKVEVHDSATGNNWTCPCDLWFDKSKDGGLLRRKLPATFTSYTKTKEEEKKEEEDYQGSSDDDEEESDEEEEEEEDNTKLSYKLSTFTSDIRFAGTNSTVFVTIFGSLVKSSGEIQLDTHSIAKGKNLFETGSKDDFLLKLPDLGEIRGVDVRIDYTGMGAGWHLDKILIQEGKQEWNFPCGKWFDKSDGDGKIERRLLPLPSVPSPRTQLNEPRSSYPGDHNLHHVLSDGQMSRQEERSSIARHSLPAIPDRDLRNSIASVRRSNNGGEDQGPGSLRGQSSVRSSVNRGSRASNAGALPSLSEEPSLVNPLARGMSLALSHAIKNTAQQDIKLIFVSEATLNHAKPEVTDEPIVVSKAILSMYSPIFKQTINQLERDKGRRGEDLPAIRVVGGLKVWNLILERMYPVFPPTELKVDVLESVLRLSYDYDIHILLQEASSVINKLQFDGNKKSPLYVLRWLKIALDTQMGALEAACISRAKGLVPHQNAIVDFLQISESTDSPELRFIALSALMGYSQGKPKLEEALLQTPLPESYVLNPSEKPLKLVLQAMKTSSSYPARWCNSCSCYSSSYDLFKEGATRWFACKACGQRMEPELDFRPKARWFKDTIPLANEVLSSLSKETLIEIISCLSAAGGENYIHMKQEECMSFDQL